MPTRLGQVLNIDIVQKETVWVTAKSNKYHLTRHCSGIKNPVETSLRDAKKAGLAPCKKCCNT